MDLALLAFAVQKRFLNFEKAAGFDPRAKVSAVARETDLGAPTSKVRAKVSLVSLAGETFATFADTFAPAKVSKTVRLFHRFGQVEIAG
jgi:hypothetical protein